MSIFNSLKLPSPKSTVFDLSHQVKTTTEFGRLTPFMFEPTIPGDNFRVNVEVFTRFAPMLAPVMHMVNVYTHFFRVDSFNLWENFKTFITGGRSGNEVPEYPRVIVSYDIVKRSIDDKINLFGPSSLWDYLGFPILADSSGKVLVPQGFLDAFDALPFLAYYKVWSIYYADENVFEFPYDDDYKLDDGTMSPDESYTYLKNCSLKFRCYEKDYFTSALPWPQRGESVRIPSSGTLESGLVSVGGEISVNYGKTREGNNLPLQDYDLHLEGPISTGVSRRITAVNGDIHQDVALRGDASQLSANVRNKNVIVQSSTINELRRAFAAQAWQETNARAGWRLPEFIRAHYGVRNSDYRYFYPHYLGGGKAPVVIGEVLQQSQSTTSGDDASPLGAMGGRGVAAGKSNSFVHKFNDYGYVIGIMSIIPRSEYQGGLPRKFQKFDRFDYAFPEFAHLGEQEIKNSELFYDVNRQTNGAVFGYTSRYAEYKFIPSTTHGDFLSTLNFWHLGRKFTSVPGLNQDFLQVLPEDNNRIFAVERDVNGRPLDHIWCQLYVNATAKRLLPKFGTPSVVSR